MALLLNIETAVEGSSVSLSEGPRVLAEKQLAVANEAGAWLHVAIHDLLTEAGVVPAMLAAVAVSAGPGSYTGLRVGMAAAKGFCYALNCRLITINTLQLMAASVAQPPAQILCPMIDARRMEVFTALYDQALVEIQSPTNLVLTANSFSDWLDKGPVCFFGNGAKKFQPLLNHSNAFFVPSITKAAHMAQLSARKFDQQEFADLAYTEPFYGKAFYSPPPRKNY